MGADTKTWIREHWLICLIAAQPLLDALAFWTRSRVGTPAGVIRLVLLAALPVAVLCRLKEKKRFLLLLTAIGVYCLLHVGNSLRVGYIRPAFDIAYLLRVIQMPVLAICFVWLIRDEQTRDQALRGVLIAAVLVGLEIVTAYVTGTGNDTYGPGLGYSGWVIEDNRTAHSIILVTLCAFCAFLGLRRDEKWLNALVPMLIVLALLTNGTKSCFYSLFALFASFAGFFVLDKLLLGRRLRGFAILVLTALMAFTVLIYPYTPRARVNQVVKVPYGRAGEIETAALALGYDVNEMTPQERYDNEEVREVFAYYYYRYFIAVCPDIFDRFGMDRVLLHYNMTTDVHKLLNTRILKVAYSAMIWEDSDLPTKLLGFEASQIGFEGTYDLENDWPAIFYYYGAVGLALYAAFVLYFLWLILRRLLQSFRESFTLLNLTLLLSLLLLLGLAQFSGAVLRRPNVSFYLSLVLGLIYCQTVRLPQGGAQGEGERL